MGGTSTADSKGNVKISEMERELGAAFVSGGIGSVALGLMIVLTEMKAGAGLKSALGWVGPVGPLSGKTGVAVIAFIVSWIALRFVFRNNPLKLTTAFYISLGLIILGLLMSFPPIFDLFAG